MTLRFGRYEAVGKLGEGAMAAVHLARDPVLDRLVAVKVLHRNVAAGKVPLQRFFNEAKTVARLANPHVVEVFDFGKQGREYYLVMEFVDGRSLSGMLKPPGPGVSGALPETPSQGHSGRPLPDDITVSLLCQAAEGLDMAARHGVVHRDIKPENLMINSQGYLKVADFGIAHLQDDSLTRTGAVLGSPLYMSPEQVRGAKPITSQSDMYSLGAVFYRCLTGFPPFASATLKDLFRKIAREAPPPLALVRPGLDPALARLVDTLLQKDPSRRGDGPRWFRAELRAWLLSRGLDDPMETVAGYLRELNRQAASTVWEKPADAVLPRTVMSTSPMTLEEAAVSYHAARTQRDDAPHAQWEEPARTRQDAFRLPRPSRTRRWALAGAGFLAAVLGLGTMLRLLTGTALQPGPVPVEGTENSGETIGDRGQDGSPTARADGGVEAVAGAGNGADEGAGAGTGSGSDSLDAAGWVEGTGGLDDGAGSRGGGTGTVASQVTRPADGPGGETGALLVQSAPPFALVFLDGNEMGVTPVQLAALSPGPHRLLIRGRSGASLDTLLEVKPGRRVLRVRLEPEIVALESPE
jgi:hypothetical protein